MARSRVAWALLGGLVACGSATRGAGGDGSGGEGGVATSNRYFDELRQRSVDKVDLLLVVDNSASMADKQQLLAQAVPLLVQRLISPICVDEEGLPTTGNTDVTGRCALGVSEFQPLHDIHVGVISSSLGSHGATGASDACVDAGHNDHAHLLGEIRGLPDTYAHLGFLAWDASLKYAPPGDTDPQAFSEKLQELVTSAGDAGCLYPATLEAWYRFLVDPEPPLNVVVEGGVVVRQGIDATILEQRAAFLRPDSVVAILMLSDKNDCSIQDEGYGFLIARATPSFRSTSQCLSNPNDLCCQSCGEPIANEGCPVIASDPECAKGTMLAALEDNVALRCYEQKRRFGYELLYPTTRYAEALRSPVVPQASTGALVQNPLFSANEGQAPRDRGLVFLAGLVGVPWQDLADPESLAGPGLRYLSAAELAATGRWDVMLGDPGANPPVLPSDPLMVESTADRTTLSIVQRHPVTGDSLVPSSSNDPNANPINGHEHANVNDSELQYACIFELPAPRDCDAADAAASCDCTAEAAAQRSPLCQPPAGGEPGTQQYYAKAYPGLRQLRVLREFGENAVVASICPKVLDPGNPDYGYNPAISGLVSRLKESFVGRCLPRPLLPEPDGSLPCQVVEVLERGADCDCAALPNRREVSLDTARTVREQLERTGYCGDSSGVPCSSWCVCELPQLEGEALSECQSSPQPPTEPGFCYISAGPDEPQVGNPVLVRDCAADSKRLLRFVGDTPARQSHVFISCELATLGR
jgi:hypothetical protein